LYSIAVTILQKPLPTSPPGWLRHRKKKKAKTNKEKHDHKNGKVLRKKFKVREFEEAETNEEKPGFNIGELFRKKFKEREIEWLPVAAGGGQGVEEEQEEAERFMQRARMWAVCAEMAFTFLDIER
jgi:hypothetical protein